MLFRNTRSFGFNPTRRRSGEVILPLLTIKIPQSYPSLLPGLQRHDLARFYDPLNVLLETASVSVRYLHFLEGQYGHRDRVSEKGLSRVEHLRVLQCRCRSRIDAVLRFDPEELHVRVDVEAVRWKRCIKVTGLEAPAGLGAGVCDVWGEEIAQPRLPWKTRRGRWHHQLPQ